MVIFKARWPELIFISSEMSVQITIPSKTISHNQERRKKQKHIQREAGRMAPEIKALATLLGDMGVILSTHKAVHSHL